MTTAFVFSGGGSLGAVQAGMLLALAEADIYPDLVVGTSVGAINAAWVAGQPDAEGARRLAEIWRGVRRNDVFPTQFVNGFLAFVGRRNCLIQSDNLRHLIAANLSFEKLEDAKLPLMVVAADITTGMEVVLSEGNALDALAASAAIPGVFPPVVIGAQTLVDGGVLNNAPISHAIDAGATRVYVLPTGYACALVKPPRGALAIALQSITLLVHQRLAGDVSKYQDVVELHVMPPLCPLTVSPIDFSHTAELIERARSSTSEWLKSSAEGTSDQTRVLKLHRHKKCSCR